MYATAQAIAYKVLEQHGHVHLVCMPTYVYVLFFHVISGIKLTRVHFTLYSFYNMHCKRYKLNLREAAKKNSFFNGLATKAFTPPPRPSGHMELFSFSFFFVSS